MVYKRPISPAKKKTSIRSSPRIKEKTSQALDSSQASIKVVVRVRPPNQRENQDNYKTVIKVCDSQMLVFDPKEEEDPFFYRGVVQKGRDILKKQNKNLEFVFNRVFDDSSTNNDVFEGSTKDMISSLLDGYNCSVFAYGATGAGKTHTMLGKEDDPGITYRTVAELFSQIEQQKDDRDFNLGVTYLEIYNENVQDLLEKKGPLFLREDGQRGVVVTGLKIITIYSAEELLGLLTRGNKNRTQFPTDANGESSRSHAVFQVYISMKNKLDQQVKRVKLSMIDLAGSERASATGCKGARFKEGANINRSLLALGNCINNLADGIKHIPYRDSKLTRLLKDSLGGNCQTIMIANISPSSFSYEDTYNTLRYANRAKKIKTTVKKNIVACMLSASDYATMLTEAKREIIALKNKLQAYENSGTPKVTVNGAAKVVPNGVANGADKEALAKKQAALVSDKLRDLMDKKRSLSEKILYLESQFKINCCKKNAKNSADERLSNLTDMPESMPQDQNASGKKRLKKSLSHFERQCERIRREVESKWAELQKVEQEISGIEKTINDKNLESFLTKDRAIFQKDFEKAVAQQQSEHTKKICSLLKCDVTTLNKLIKNMSPLLQSYYQLLNENGILTNEMKEEFRKTVRNLEGARNLTWEDEPSKEDKDFYNMIILDVQCVQSPLKSSAPVFENEEAGSQEDVENVEASNSLNNTFDVDTSSKGKKRALIEQNSVEKDVSPAKRMTAAIKKSSVSGKENGKDVSKTSARNLDLINRLKVDKTKSSTALNSKSILLKDKNHTKTAILLGQKSSK